MRIPIRPLVASVLVGATFLVGSGVTAHSRATAYSPRVYIFDNDGAFQGGDPGTGEWGYYPGHIDVYQGEQIEFDSPASNKLPHTVTSITWTGSPPDRQLTAGTAFNSSPTRDQFITPGNSFVLDTSTLNPGQYLYYCAIHPWMVGTITVEPPESQ